MYYFIVNPNARNGQGNKIWKRLEKQLEHTGVIYEVHLTKETGDSSAIAARLTEGCRDPKTIIVVGGDGTFNEVLDGLSFCGPITLGYIPAGSGNDLARSLRLPKRPEKCLKKILNPRYHKLMDYGVLSYGSEVVNHRRFAVSTGIGMDAAVCHRLLEIRGKRTLKKTSLGKMSYVLSGIKQLLTAHPVKGYLILDGVQKVELNHIYFISAHIHPDEGGGFRFAPEAKIDDGCLDICVVHQSCKWRLIPILTDAFLRRNRKHRGLRHYRCKEVQIHTEREMPVHVDGESCLLQRDLEICCIEKKIRMII